MIPRFSAAFLSVFNGFCGASADTGHAMGAILIPDRTIVLHGDVVHGTSIYASSASGTGVQRIERTCLDTETIETGIYKATFHSICQSNRLLRERLALANGICTAL